MKKVLLAIAVALTSLTASAQDGKFTAWYGANMADISADGDVDAEFKFVNIGVDYTAPINETFDWTAGVSYVTKGCKDWSPSFIQIDANAGWKFFQSDDINLSVLAGPYAGYMVGKDGDGIKSALDFGLSAGFKAEYKQFSVKLGYEFGFTDLMKYDFDNAPDVKSKNSNIYIRLGYSF